MPARIRRVGLLWVRLPWVRLLWVRLLWVGLVLLSLTVQPAAASVLPAATPDEPAQGEISDHAYTPLRTDASGRPLTVVQMAGRDLLFRIDTAAEQSALYQTAAFLLDLETVPLATQRVYTATGARQFLLFNVPSVRVFGRDRPARQWVALPSQGDGSAVGLIGIDMMTGKGDSSPNTGVAKTTGHILHIRRSQGDIALLSAQDFSSHDMSAVRGFAVARGAVAIDIRIGQLDIPAVIDTGASNTVMTRAAVRQLAHLSPDAAPDMAAAVPVTIAAGAGSLRGQRVTMSAMHIGEHRYSDIQVTVADLPIFTLLGARDAPAMLLGVDILNRGDYAIDFHRRTLWLGTLNDDPPTAGQTRTGRP